MATKKPSRSSIADLRQQVEVAIDQFRGLNLQNPAAWPLWPRRAALFLAGSLALLGVWFLLIQSESDELESARAREVTLRKEFKEKLRVAANLSEYQRQKVQVQEYVAQLEKQLPGRSDIDALLSDVNQSGVGRGLQFELFKPAPEVIREHYAELPVSIKVTGRYHDLGAFASDLATLPRIVTLRNISLASPPPSTGTASNAAATVQGSLTMEGTIRTYRYLDEAELAAQRKAKVEAAKKGKS